jgi:FixJ family two-component response regulator
LNAQTTAQPVVFVIDDQDAVRNALGEMLRVFGYIVRLFESADAFLAALTGEEAGCIVADVRMPGTDGIELVRELARRNSTLPVVLISGHADVQGRRGGLHREAGRRRAAPGRHQPQPGPRLRPPAVPRRAAAPA